MLSPHFIFTWLVRPSLSFLLSLSLSLSLSVESRGTWTNPGRRVTRVTKFCTVGPHIFGSPVRNWLHITLRLYWILRWFIYIYIYIYIYILICGPLVEWKLQTISHLQKFGCILCDTNNFHSHVFQIGVCLSTGLSLNENSYLLSHTLQQKKWRQQQHILISDTVTIRVQTTLQMWLPLLLLLKLLLQLLLVLDMRLYEGKNCFKLGRSKFLRETENHTVTQRRIWK